MYQELSEAILAYKANDKLYDWAFDLIKSSSRRIIKRGTVTDYIGRKSIGQLKKKMLLNLNYSL